MKRPYKKKKKKIQEKRNIKYGNKKYESIELCNKKFKNEKYTIKFKKP